MSSESNSDFNEKEEKGKTTENSLTNDMRFIDPFVHGNRSDISYIIYSYTEITLPSSCLHARCLHLKLKVISTISKWFTNQNFMCLFAGSSSIYWYT